VLIVPHVLDAQLKQDNALAHAIQTNMWTQLQMGALIATQAVEHAGEHIMTIVTHV